MSSSGSISTTTVNGTTRITGLSSGIDVDSIVDQLMTANKTKLNKLKQKEQLAEWKQEGYRDIISDIQSFANKYFNVSSSSNIMSKKNFQALSATSSNAAVTATTTTSAVAGSHTVAVSQLATAASKSTAGRLSPDIAGKTAADEINYDALAGTSFTLTVDGTAYTVSLDDTVTDIDSLQTAIDNAVGENKVKVSTDAGFLTMAATKTVTDGDGNTADSGVQVITVGDPASGTSALSALGLSSGQSNRISTSVTLADLAAGLGAASDDFFDSDGQVELTINGVSFSFDKTETTLAEMISEINSSKAGVTMKYDELADKLVLTAAATGAGNTLNITETGSSFLTTALGGSLASGTDAKLTVDGVSLTRSSNTVTVGGITYTLNQVTDTAAVVNLTQDVDAVYDNITSFVDAYNELIKNINAKLSEKYDSDYPPLTDDEKEEMSDDEIKNWETKAKTGLLARDNTLQSFLGNMRQAIMDSVSGLNLAGIGITTGTYDEKGKLHIDEDDLKKAIKNNPAGIMNLFTQQSATYSGTASARKLTASQRAVRYNEEGLAYRLYDVIQDNISTYTDSNGNKGLLLLKAGTENDSTEGDNALSDQITAIKKKIAKEEDWLDSLSDRLYEQYTSLETYINQMNTQLSSLSSYMSE